MFVCPHGNAHGWAGPVQPAAKRYDDKANVNEGRLVNNLAGERGGVTRAGCTGALRASAAVLRLKLNSFGAQV